MYTNDTANFDEQENIQEQPVPQVQPALPPQGQSELPPVLQQLNLAPEAIDALVEYAFGVPRSQMQAQLQYVQQRQREDALTPLRNEWGQDFDTNFAAVAERFKQLTPQQQAVYDNPDGARFLLQQIRQESQQQSAVPTFDKGRSTRPTGSGKTKFTMSQIKAMTPADYKANAQEIQAAFAQGLVDTQN